MIRALRYVDEVITYNTIDEDIKNIDFNIFARGADQNHTGFLSATKWCEDNGRQVIILPRTEGISSSYLKNMVLDLSEKQEKT